MPAPQAEESPYAPTTIEPFLFERFAGINTATLRAGVPDEQCAWIDGFFPLAPRNLRTMYGVGSTPLYTSGGGVTIVFYEFGNLGTTPVCIVFLSDGSVVQVNTNTTVVTQILPPTWITAPSITTCGMTQWGSQYIIIVTDQPNGYYVWDGASAFIAGSISPIVTLTDPGSGYTSAPTVTLIGGHGFGVILTAQINATIGVVTGVSVNNPGRDYLPTDSVSVNFFGGNTGGSGASITAGLSLNISTGYTVVNSLSIVASGSLYSNNPSLTFAGGGVLVPATAVVTTVTGGSILGVSITNGGRYIPPAPTVVITDVATTASATVQLMPYGIQGTTVETYQGRVWVAKQATVQFTAPGSFADFSTSNGGGNFTSVDSFLQIGFVQLISVNGFLYLIADSSVNYISGVQTSGTPPTTTFTNQNADPEVGTPYPASVETFGRTVLFANAFGVHVCNGGQVSKVSEMLDGVYNTVSNFGGLQLSSSEAVIFGRKVWMTLVKIVDPITGQTVNKLFMWNGKLWWASAQDMTLTYVKHQELNSVITAWGTDGTTIKALFSTPSTGFTKTAQSRLWDAPGGYQYEKTIGRLWGMGYFWPGSSVAPVSFAVDNEKGLQASPYTLTSASLGYWITPPKAVGQQGVLQGLTIRTTAADFSLISAMLQPDAYYYRG